MTSGVARYSQLFIPTLKQAPSDALAPSHQLLVRTGCIRQLLSGVYSYLPLGWRTLRRIEAVVRDEMEAIGGQELLLPALQPAELWRESGRWDDTGVTEVMFRLRDRKGSDLCLGITHEEAVTALARDELRSYRQLPQIWYQIQTKFRDEARPRAGLLRLREFLMKDAYSFAIDASGLEQAYDAHRGVYERIFRRCGLDAVAVEAHSGAMGGRTSKEFVVRTDWGEDQIAVCSAATCQYAANLEAAVSRPDRVLDPEEMFRAAPERFATPGVVTIDALAQPPYGVHPRRQLKTLVYVADGAPVIAVVRGDHTVNDAKLQTAISATHVRPAHGEEILPLMGAHAGSLGAVGAQRAPVVVDLALDGRAGMVTGANDDGLHLRGVDVARDILAHGAHLAALRTVTAGDGCPRCDSGTLEIVRALEVGHIFQLGTRYSTALGATVLLEDGSASPLVMGSYGIGIGRIMAAAVEAHHDADGIVWPRSIAPYDVTVVPLGRDPELIAAAEQVAATVAATGLAVLYDDREERPGVKLKDADLIGIPLRIAVGPKSLARGMVEWKPRGLADVELMPMGAVGGRAQAWRDQSE